jgi:hypothetical protein
MATVVNFMDTTLQAAAARGVNLPTADIQLLPSAPLFKVGADGSITPESITFTATLIDLDAPLTFNATGAPLANVQARSVTVAGAAMTGSSVTVIASVTVNGRTYTKPCTVQKFQDGVVGSTTYTWIKYADSAVGAGLSDDPTGKAYIGLAYNKTSPAESTIASDYTWSLIRGTDGQPGQPGADGVQLYTWIKYSDNANGAGLYDLPTSSTLYIGIAVNKTTATESSNPADYVWSRFKGDQGVPGPALYTWIKYADSAAGAGLTDDPTGKAYIGFAYNKTTAVESENPADYAWSLNQGGQGVPGQPGKDGTTYYTWIKYADAPDGTGLYDVPNSSTVYIGIAVNKVTATESTNKADYTWSKFRGDQGVPGNPGQPGQRGTVDISAGTAGSTWSDSEATAAIAQTGYGTPQMLDVVTLYNQAAGFASTRYWNGSAWIPVSQVINGSLLVKNTVAADKIDTRGLSIKDDAGSVILAAGSALPAAYAAPGTLNSDLAPSIPVDLVLIPFNATVTGNRAVKSNVSSAWDAQVASKDGFVGGAFASGSVDKLCTLMFGLNTDPHTDANFASIDFAIYAYVDGTLQAFESGTQKATLGTYAPGDLLAVMYDGSSVRYCKNGVVLYTSMLGTPVTGALYLDSSFNSIGAALSNIRFGPLSSNNWASVGGTGKPSDNASSDLVLVGRGVTVSGNTATKTGGTAGWNADCFSRDSFAGGAFGSVVAASVKTIMFGLNTDPETDSDFNSIDYAMFMGSDGSLRAYEYGVNVGPLGNYGVGDVLSLIYDGSNIRYLKNGASLRSVAVAITAPLFFDSSFLDIGARLTNIRFGPMSSNAWASIGGQGKPQDGATIGAPSGTYVGGTEAGLVASRALNGDAAFNAVSDPTLGLASRLRSNAQNVLRDGAALTVGSLVTDASGQRVSGYGLGFTSYGFVAYNAAGAPTITVNGATGVIAVAGDLSGSTGTFGAVTVGVSLSCGQSAYHTGTGFFLGLVGGVPKFSIGKPGTSSLRWDGTQLIAENLSASMTPLPVSISTTGNNLTTSYGRNASAASTVVGYVSVTGGSGNYTYNWSVTADGYACWTTNPAGSNCAGVMKGPGIAMPDGVGFTLVCTVTDQTTGRSGQASFSPTIIFQ